MERINFIYFVLGALSLFVGILAQPYVKQLWSAVKSSIRHRKNTKPNVYCDDLQSQIDELKEQMDNVAANSYSRDRDWETADHSCFT